MVVNCVAGAVRVSDSGIAVVGPSTIRGTSTEALALIRNGADSPDTVSPLKTHVARARTRPKFAGMFGSTQLPSGLTRTLRFRHADDAVLVQTLRLRLRPRDLAGDDEQDHGTGR